MSWNLTGYNSAGEVVFVSTLYHMQHDQLEETVSWFRSRFGW